MDPGLRRDDIVDGDGPVLPPHPPFGTLLRQGRGRADERSSNTCLSWGGGAGRNEADGVRSALQASGC
jgi:hypothetical protein